MSEFSTSGNAISEAPAEPEAPEWHPGVNTRMPPISASKGWSRREVTMRETERDIKTAKRQSVKLKTTKRKTLDTIGADCDTHSDVRHFHNSVKSELYKYAMTHFQSSRNGPFLLDLSCGRGGDIHKWRKSGFKNITGVDVNEDAIHEAKKRWRNADYRDVRAFFAVQDLTSPNLLENMGRILRGAFECCSMHFAIHYIANPARSKALETLFQGISTWLKPGGIFICTYPDGDRILKMLDDEGEFDNGFLKIKENTQKGGVDFSADFGSKGTSSYFHEFGSSHEWTVSPRKLRKLVENQGLEILRDDSFLNHEALLEFPLMLDEKEFSGVFRYLVVRKSHKTAWFPTRAGINFQALQIDDVGKYSITRPGDITKIHGVIKSFTRGCQISKAVDATACVGGDTIALAEYCTSVHAWEIDSSRFDMLSNNVACYGHTNVELTNGNFLDSEESGDLLYMDPPWGGRAYTEHASVELFLCRQNIINIVPKLSERFTTIVVKVPFNFSFPQFGKQYRISDRIVLWIIQSDTI